MFFQQKTSPFFFISCCGCLSLFFSLSFADLLPIFSFSLSFSFSKFEICGHENYSKLNTLHNTYTETISACCFHLYWLSGCQDADGHAISRQNNLELHLGCHACWLSYFTLVCLWCGRAVGRTYGHVVTKISRMSRSPHFPRYGATLVRALSSAVIIL